MSAGKLMMACIGLLLSLACQADGSVVILQYHNVSVDTPRSTSVSLDELKTHIQWLKDNRFQIKALDTALEELQNGDYSNQDRIAAITFDDSHVSVCTTAWAYLKQENIPFTLFVNTDPVERKFNSQCTITQMQDMAKSGLVILGNHGKTHAHMTKTAGFADHAAWLSFVRDEILHAQAFLDNHFGEQPKLFAYPYGEYNNALQALLKQSGYIAFGQQSGAVGAHSDFLGLPRFPLSGTYASMKTYPDKMRSLAFPAVAEVSSDNPVDLNSAANPPRLTLQLKSRIDSKVNCFLASGKPINVQQYDDRIVVQHDGALSAGRQRYNCTAASGIPGRYYWFSHQWLLE